MRENLHSFISKKLRNLIDLFQCHAVTLVNEIITDITLKMIVIITLHNEIITYAGLKIILVIIINSVIQYVFKTI